ncbi:hypothetical protein Q5O89_15835 [Peribacillus frigoritolerans]|nr:hypothetical protein [Peribacillus frigoritolerans]
MSDKKKYQAIVNIKDLKDKGKIYRNGDTFPNTANKKVEDGTFRGTIVL